MPSTRLFPCPRGCGTVFTRPAALKKHLEGTGKYCWSALRKRIDLESAGRREDNVVDVIARRLESGTFMPFITDTVRRQLKAERRTKVTFIPYGKSHCVAVDVGGLGARFRGHCKASGARGDRLLARALSTALAICLFWTDRAVALIRMLPYRWSKNAEDQLRERFLAAARKKHVICSSAIQACQPRSIHKCSFVEARS